MMFFGKKDDDFEDGSEFDLEEEKKEKRDDRKLTRKFKDLNPENRKKRKEPPKPWGRKERAVVFISLFSTVAISSFLALNSRDYNLPGFPKLSFKNLLETPGIFGEDKVVLGKKTVSDTKFSEIKREFSDKVEKLSGTYSLYVYEFEEDKETGFGEDEEMSAASLIKLPVFIALYKEAEEGRINLDEKYSLKDSDKKSGSGNLSSKPAGTTITYREMAEMMGKFSDNTAFNILKNKLGEEKIKKVIGEIGMTKTSLEKNTTSPRDVGILFKKLKNVDLVNSEHSDEILGYMTDTIYENWIAKEIPPEIKVAHKYGREVHVVNDAGIIFTPKPFVIVIMSQGVVDDQADEALPVLARMVYELVK